MNAHDEQERLIMSLGYSYRFDSADHPDWRFVDTLPLPVLVHRYRLGQQPGNGLEPITPLVTVPGGWAEQEWTTNLVIDDAARWPVVWPLLVMRGWRSSLWQVFDGLESVGSMSRLGMAAEEAVRRCRELPRAVMYLDEYSMNHRRFEARSMV